MAKKRTVEETAKATPARARAGTKRRTRESIIEPLRRATAALKKEWQSAERRIVRLRGEGAAAFDELYEEVHAVMSADPPVYLGGGMRNETEFIAKMLPGEDARSVARNVLVAVAFSARDEQTKGLSFLEEVAKYVMELSGSKALPRAIDLDRLRIPVLRADGDVVRKSARECTREEVVAARDALGKKTKRRPTPIEKAISGVLAKRKTLARVKVRAAGATAAFSGVPVGELAAFGAALARLELPQPG